MKPQPRPDWIPREQIQAVLRKKTGVLVSKQRIGRWINTGELKTLKAPSGRGYRSYTTEAWLDSLVEKHVYSEPSERFGGLLMPRVTNSEKPKFYFPRKREEK